MTFLKMLESIRTPFWDQVAAAVTLLGEETFFMLVGLALVWCFDKRWGFQSAVCGADRHSAQPAAQGGVPHPPPLGDRPGVYHRGDGARRRDGYSFPSGHTQSAACVLGMLALWVRDRVFTALCVLGILAVAFSRMVSWRAYAAGCGVWSLLTGADHGGRVPRLFDRRGGIRARPAVAGSRPLGVCAGSAALRAALAQAGGERGRV